MKQLLFVIIISSTLISITACQQSVNSNIDLTNNETVSVLNLPSTTYTYANNELPDYLINNQLIGPGQNAAVNNDNTPADNPITDAGATLGRVLFYDKSLSANGSISCASCHNQANGFSDDQILSKGFDGGETRRHSMSLINARWYKNGRFFWDERAATLEEQILEPFQDPIEMGLSVDQLIEKVASQSFYNPLFEDAFGSDEVTSDKISFAIAQFIRSMVSVNSKYDEGRAQVNRHIDDFPNFSESENNGNRLFILPTEAGGGGCIGYHSTEAFINPDNGTTNNGLDAVNEEDLGVFETFNNPRFLGAFKVPSLKSIALSAPYMHDGRFASLEEVVEHYNSGVQNHPNLAIALRDPLTGQPKRLNFTEQQKTDLVNFLKTLTDENLASDVKFSNPFIE